MDRREFRKKFWDHVQEKDLPENCPVCDQEDWAIGFVVRFPLLGGSTYYALIPLACGNCGYTYWFNAVQVGFSEEELTEFEANGPPDEPITAQEAEVLQEEAEQ